MINRLQVKLREETGARSLLLDARESCIGVLDHYNLGYSPFYEQSLIGLLVPPSIVPTKDCL